MLLKNPDIEITEEVLSEALQDIYEIYSTIQKDLSEQFGLQYLWRFYKDGNAWLCKVVFKKKTIFWLSIWEDCFKVTFYFTEKTASGIYDLPVNQRIMDLLLASKHIGKFIPLTLEIKNDNYLSDFKEIIKYKLSLK